MRREFAARMALALRVIGDFRVIRGWGFVQHDALVRGGRRRARLRCLRPGRLSRLRGVGLRARMNSVSRGERWVSVEAKTKDARGLARKRGVPRRERTVRRRQRTLDSSRCDTRGLHEVSRGRTWHVPVPSRLRLRAGRLKRLPRGSRIKNMCQNCFKPNRLKGISGEARATDRQVNRSISKRQADFRSKKLGFISVISHLAARFASRVTRDRPPHTPPSTTRAATRTSSLDSDARRFPERPADAFRDRDARRSRVNS